MIFIGAVVLVGVLTISAGSIFVASKVTHLKQEILRLEENFINEQKKQLHTDVNNLIANVDYRQEHVKNELKQELKKQVEEARMIATNIYLSTLNTLSMEEIRSVIIEAIRPIRFHDEQGYCFIVGFDGKLILYPIDENLEGESFLELTSKEEDGAAERMIHLALHQGQGFIQYNWYKPGDSSEKRYPKLSYVSRFDPLSMILGTGDYLDNIENLAQKEILSGLSNSWRAKNLDYFFVYKLLDMAGGENFATMLLNINRPDLVGQTLSDDVVDVEGTHYRQEFLDGIQKKGEAYVVYRYKKPDGSGVGRKLSYFKLYPRWNWIVAKGVYLDKLDATILAREKKLRESVKQDFLLLCLIFAVGVIVSLIFALWFAREMQRIFTSYNRLQKTSLSQLKNLNVTLEKQSRTDALTGIANRGYFNEWLEVILAEAEHYNKRPVLIMFDIDHFKVINDSFGHPVGDIVLQEISHIIQKNIRQDELFARYGGEEFVLLIENFQENNELMLAEKLRKLIANHTFSSVDHVTCSFGVASYLLGDELEDILYRADKALYAAKSKGRNCCVHAHDL